MPCRDYEGQAESTWNQDRLDLITRIACKALRAYAKKGHPVGLLLDDTELNWWISHKKADEARIQREEEAARIEKLRKSALAKLTWEEQKVLNFGF